MLKSAPHFLRRWLGFTLMFVLLPFIVFVAFRFGTREYRLRTNLEPPLTREELGHAGWALLHTIAANYPEQPSPLRARRMKDMILAIGDLYPCRTCAQNFRKYLIERGGEANVELATRSRASLAVWLCEAHNSVNERLGRALFDCRRALTHWPAKLRSSCGCGDNATETESDLWAAEAAAQAAAGLTPLH